MQPYQTWTLRPTKPCSNLPLPRRSWRKLPLTTLGFLGWILNGLWFQPQTAQADFFLHGWENQYVDKPTSKVQLNVMYYTTSDNYSGTGSLYSPTGFSDYTRIQDDLIFAHRFFGIATVYGRLTWAYINMNSSPQDGSAFGLTDQSVGTSIRLYSRTINEKTARFLPSKLDFQFQTDFPGYTNNIDTSNPKPFLGDGSTDITTGLFLTSPLYFGSDEMLTVTYGAGYTNRNLTFSSAVPWSVLFDYQPPEDTGFIAQLGVLGLHSLGTDSNSSTSSILKSSQGTGGSFITGGINPSLIQVRGRAGYRFTPDMELSLFASQSVWGRSAPNGLTIGLNFQARIGRDPKPHPVLKSNKEHGHSNAGFKRYSLDAKVLKSNDRLNLVKINKGSQDGIEVGQIFDLFSTRKNGTIEEAIARGKVQSAKPDEAALEVTEYFKKVWIDEGFVAKRLIQ